MQRDLSFGTHSMDGDHCRIAVAGDMLAAIGQVGIKCPILDFHLSFSLRRSSLEALWQNLRPCGEPDA